MRPQATGDGQACILRPLTHVPKNPCSIFTTGHRPVRRAIDLERPHVVRVADVRLPRRIVEDPVEPLLANAERDVRDGAQGSASRRR